MATTIILYKQEVAANMNTGDIITDKSSSNIALGLKNNTLEDKEKEKIRQIVKEKQFTKKTLDSFEKEKLTDVLYELYPHYKVTKEMPKSMFGDQFGYDMQKKISDCMKDYYEGKISQSNVQDYLEECCISMQKYRTGKGQTSGNDVMDKKQIISEVYEIFAKENARAARNANCKEGEALNETYGGREDDWVYYNSDYHYQCEEMKDVLQKTVGNMTAKWKIPDIDTEEIEKKSDLTLDGGFDFNSGWNFIYRNQVGRGSIEDESLTPPKNFKFFFKESYSDEGSLWMSLDGRQITSRTGILKGQICHVNDLVEDFLKSGNNNEQFRNFLKNITVFTRWYSLESGINNVFGNYASQNA